MFTPYYNSLAASRVVPLPRARRDILPMPTPPPQAVSSRLVPTPVVRPEAGQNGMSRLRRAVDVIGRDVARQCAQWARHLQAACDAFARYPNAEFPQHTTDIFGVTHAMSMGLDLPFSAQAEGLASSAAGALGTSAPPQTPDPHLPAALWANYQQLDVMDAALCGPDALCTLTLEPLHALHQPVAACQGTAVQVYEYAALQEFWQVFPQRRNFSPSYMPIASLCRVVNVEQQKTL